MLSIKTLLFGSLMLLVHSEPSKTNKLLQQEVSDISAHQNNSSSNSSIDKDVRILNTSEICNNVTEKVTLRQHQQPEENVALSNNSQDSIIHLKNYENVTLVRRNVDYQRMISFPEINYFDKYKFANPHFSGKGRENLVNDGRENRNEFSDGLQKRLNGLTLDDMNDNARLASKITIDDINENGRLASVKTLNDMNQNGKLASGSELHFSPYHQDKTVIEENENFNLNNNFFSIDHKLQQLKDSLNNRIALDDFGKNYYASARDENALLNTNLGGDGTTFPEESTNKNETFWREYGKYVNGEVGNSKVSPLSNVINNDDNEVLQGFEGVDNRDLSNHKLSIPSMRNEGFQAYGDDNQQKNLYNDNKVLQAYKNLKSGLSNFKALELLPSSFDSSQELSTGPKEVPGKIFKEIQSYVPVRSLKPLQMAKRSEVLLKDLQKKVDFKKTDIQRDDDDDDDSNNKNDNFDSFGAKDEKSLINYESAEKVYQAFGNDFHDTYRAVSFVPKTLDDNYHEKLINDDRKISTSEEGDSIDGETLKNIHFGDEMKFDEIFDSESLKMGNEKLDPDYSTVRSSNKLQQNMKKKYNKLSYYSPKFTPGLKENSSSDYESYFGEHFPSKPKPGFVPPRTGRKRFKIKPPRHKFDNIVTHIQKLKPAFDEKRNMSIVD